MTSTESTGLQKPGMGHRKSSGAHAEGVCLGYNYKEREFSARSGSEWRWR